MNDFAAFAPWLPAIGGVLGLLCLWGAMSAGRQKRLVDNLPTSKTTGVFIGLVELKGTAETGEPLTSFLAETLCVHYEWGVEEHWTRTVTETYTDSEGKSQTRTRQESGWTVVASGGETAGAFYLQDDCGYILVRPEGAKLEPATVFSETCTPLNPLYYGKGPAFAVADSDHTRQFREAAIPLHAQLYVMGQSREREDVVAPEIACDKKTPLFLISTRSEEQISSGFGWAFWGWGIFGFLLAVGGLIGRDAGMQLDVATRWPWYLLPAFGYFAAAGLAWVWMVFNSLVDLRQRVRQGWSQVDVQLKRRHDLIPNLVNIVKGLCDHEAKLQTALAGLRAQLEATPPGVAGPDYHACSNVLVAVKEAYPGLVAQESFAQLQKELVDTEQRIALARGYFNEIATHYNTRLEIVPDRFIATLARLQPQALMAANDFERAPVTVDFTQ
ncbi:MAG: LemA family protein [Verrucomicrobia bacterium]|nr:LemA family protein [Verrucomicrobiota bacterium]